MKEAELALKFIEYFRDADVFKEVQIPCGIVDFVAIYGRAKTAVEVKNTCSLAVIGQAYRNRSYFNYSYIAVPTCPDSFQRLVCRQFGIGILRYESHGDRVTELEKPDFRRRTAEVALHEFQKQSVAGSVYDRETHFSNSIKEIKALLRRCGDLPLKDLFVKSRTFHWSSLYSARNSFASLVKRGIIKGIEINDGIVKLTTRGQNHD